MEIVDLNSNSNPLSTSYVGDADIKFISVLDNSEEGYSFYKENHLRNLSDRKINNYSALYLSNKQKLTDFIQFEKLETNLDVSSFNTTISDSNGLYLTMSAVSGTAISYHFTTKNQKFVDPIDTIFLVTLSAENLKARISHRDKNRITHYLNLQNNQFSLTVSPLSTTIFDYILDKENNKLNLFRSASSVIVTNSDLALSPTIYNFKKHAFNVNYYLQYLEPKINTSWASYNPFHKNAYDVDPFKSRSNLENNYLITTQYSYITGDTINVNILNLKNQNTHKNYNYRSDYLEKANSNVPVVDNRNYFGLFTGNDQEKGDYSITLSYEFYNADYKLAKDQYTIFQTPESIYPYTQININDLEWNYRGAIAGENPYLSDKIFQRKSEMNGYKGEYLCSWLHKDRNGGSTWLDRYYHPEKTSYAAALSTSFNYTYIDPIDNLLHTKLSASEYYDVPDIYNTLDEEYENSPQTIKSALYGISYFDKRSDLTILPNSEYIYHRIGDVYVKSIINSLSSMVIKNGLDFINGKDATIYFTETDFEEIEYIFNNDSYCLFQDYKPINDEHQFTIAFWLKSDDWSKRFGHQIFGNLNDKGIALLDDQKITPFIMVQSGKKLYMFNTNFENLDIASLTNEETVLNSKINDVYRTDHLDAFYTINIA